jgi:hypothetical protein
LQQQLKTAKVELDLAQAKNKSFSDEVKRIL